MANIEEDFSRLFSLVSSLAEITAKNTEDIGRTEAAVQSLVNVTSVHQQTLDLYQERHVQDQQRFDAILLELRNQHADIQEIQAEVRGLQTENRRILDQLINRNDNE